MGWYQTERPSLPCWGWGRRFGGVTLGDPEGQGWCMEGQRNAASDQEKMTDLEGARRGDPGFRTHPVPCVELRRLQSVRAPTVGESRARVARGAGWRRAGLARPGGPTPQVPPQGGASILLRLRPTQDSSRPYRSLGAGALLSRSLSPSFRSPSPSSGYTETQMFQYCATL